MTVRRGHDVVEVPQFNLKRKADKSVVCRGANERNAREQGYLELE